MAEKKKGAATKLWQKILIVGACVLFVVLMIVSGMGSSWLGIFKVVRPGDTVTVDYTLYDAQGNPVMTTDQQEYLKTASVDRGLVLAKTISITANQTLSRSLFPVQIYTTGSGWGRQFALFSPEYNAISAALVGMKVNEEKRITIPSAASMTQVWSAEQLSVNKVNISDVNIGDILAMGVSDNPQAESSNTSAITYIRTGSVTEKTTTDVVVDFGYPSADIRVVSINTG